MSIQTQSLSRSDIKLVKAANRTGATHSLRVLKNNEVEHRREFIGKGTLLVKTPTIDLLAYDKFAQLGLPLFITEITIPSTLEQGEAGEEIQAEVLTNLYRLWFGMSNMAGIVYWNLPDGRAWKQEGLLKAGLLDEDLQEKPAYQALDRLINHEWRTRLTAKTDSQGKARFRGFYGKYRVAVTIGSRSQQFEIDLCKKGPGSFALSWQP